MPPAACRSLLFLPASNARAMAKARNLPADLIILDLEDAVGDGDKVMARQAAVAALASGEAWARRVLVRVNGLDTPWGADDLDALQDAAPLGVVVPKVSRAADLDAVRDRCGAPLWPMIETPAALFHLDDIAAGPGVAGLVLGLNDLGAALRCRAGPNRTAFHTAMSLTVAAARSHGLAAIDAVFNDLEDPEGFGAECRQGRDFGFDGKALIHPAQIQAANSAFSPDDQDLAWARAVVDAFDQPANASQGAIRVGGRQAERLHLAEARRLLTLHGIYNSP